MASPRGFAHSQRPRLRKDDSSVSRKVGCVLVGRSRTFILQTQPKSRADADEVNQLTGARGG